MMQETTSVTTAPADAGMDSWITTDPEVLGGEPVFRGTRVPVASLFEHLSGDCSLDEFLDCFPTVSREAAVAVLLLSRELTMKL
jgi:uncharacterized protein (DUF433 family)